MPAYNIEVSKAKIVHYTYQGEENSRPKKYEGVNKNGKNYIIANFTAEATIAVWDKTKNENIFQKRQFKCMATGYIAEQFFKEYDMNPATNTQIAFRGAVVRTLSGKIQDGEFSYNAYADTIEIEWFMLKNIEKSNQSENAYNDAPESIPSGIEDDIPF